MADTRDKVGRAGVFLAGGVFKTAVYIFIIHKNLPLFRRQEPQYNICQSCLSRS